MTQQNLLDFVKELEEIGQLIRITEEKRVDELPALMCLQCEVMVCASIAWMIF